jgi:hypothetical protein
MRQAMWTGDEIEADVRGAFTTHHRLHAASGELGTLTLPAFSYRGIFRFVDGKEIVVERTSWWRGWHEMRVDGIVVGTARPVGFWRQKMSIGFRGQVYELVSVNWWGRGWRLLEDGDDDRAVIEVQPRGVLRRGAYLQSFVPVPTDLLVFVYYLVNARWQEQASAAAASSAAAGS